MSKRRTNPVTTPATALDELDQLEDRLQDDPAAELPADSPAAVTDQVEAAEAAQEQEPVSPRGDKIVVPAKILTRGRLEFPLGELPEEQLRAGQYYLTEHVDVQLDCTRQRRGLRRLWIGLVELRAVLADGRPVKSHADAVRWLCEQLETEAGQ